MTGVLVGKGENRDTGKKAKETGVVLPNMRGHQKLEQAQRDSALEPLEGAQHC